MAFGVRRTLEARVWVWVEVHVTGVGGQITGVGAKYWGLIMGASHNIRYLGLL